MSLFEGFGVGSVKPATSLEKVTMIHEVGILESCSRTFRFSCALGLERDHTTEFSSIRRKTVDKAYLEVSRLEKRLTKLTQLLTNPIPDQAQGGLLWSLTGTKAQQQRQLEQSVVTWEEDANVLRCPFCQQEFSNYSFRRHHCRLCGRVVCGDPITGCSTEVGLNVAARTSHHHSNLDLADGSQ